MESLSSRAWNEQGPPDRILIIRMHAIGDVAITLPYCVALREKFPYARIDFLTSSTCADLPSALTIFDNIFIFPTVKNRLSRLLHTLRWNFRAIQMDYDIILDLQRNWVSRAIRRFAHPRSWGEFNRTAPKPAGERTQDTFRTAGVSILPNFSLPIRPSRLKDASQKLKEHGWDGSRKLIVLNPAGLFHTRNWPIENYVRLAQLWLMNEPVQFLLLGTERIMHQASLLKDELDTNLITLVNQTTLSETFAVLQYASGIVSEDSGLMHMAWVSGIPTIGLFGSSRHDWSRPLGTHSVCLHSGDLECGACMSAICKYQDVHCLTRYTPEYVLERGRSVFQLRRKEAALA